MAILALIIIGAAWIIGMAIEEQGEKNRQAMREIADEASWPEEGDGGLEMLNRPLGKSRIQLRREKIEEAKRDNIPGKQPD